MERIYTEHQKECTLVRSGSETIQFLINFSRSFHVISYKDLKFDNILN
jgi:hypothetical protein